MRISINNIGVVFPRVGSIWSFNCGLNKFGFEAAVCYRSEVVDFYAEIKTLKL